MVVVLLLSGASVSADDWPTYRHDAARSGITNEKVAVPLAESWVFRALHAPKPAWGDPKPGPVENILELRRVHFDDVFQPVIAGGAGSGGRCAVFFGSSANNKVYCLDAATGQIRWTKITGGPVRLAPMVVDGRVYVGSDDGYAYCLDAKDGSVVWKIRGAPEDRHVLGHGKMISLWPLRTGVLVSGKNAHFSAGIFPAESVFLYAVNAADGRKIWCNGSGGETPQSRISPQGYLLSSAKNLYVPMGRVSPAAFNRNTGQLAAASPFFGKTVGGTYALLAGGDMYTGTEEMVGYRSGSRDRFATFAGRKMVVTAETAYLANNTQLKAVDRKDSKTARWATPCPCADSLILAGDVLFAGGAGQVTAVDAKTGNRLWNAEVAGIAKGLAVADGRLLVSTDKGMIYSFAAEGSPKHGQVSEPVDENPFAGSPHAAVFREAAEKILKETGIRRGYCLVAGVETGQLAFELAKRSELMIYAVSPDAVKVAAARKALDAAGVYGDRVCVEQWPLDKVPYSDYFANLIVSETALIGGIRPSNLDEMTRMLKPLGGRIVIAVPDDSPSTGGAPGKLRPARGALPGAGSWTHQYGEPGNTACGDDQLVKAPLRVLWFGQPGPGRMVQRHSRAAGPLSLDGRLFVQGENVVMAYDAYNGLELWRREILGAMRTTASHDTSNLVLSRDGLFVAVGDKCLRLDPATGDTTATYPLPPATAFPAAGGTAFPAAGGTAFPAAKDAGSQPRRWGYIACVGELLYGSRTSNMRDSDCLFAMDIVSGKCRWVYSGKQIPHNTIAIDGGRVFLVSNHATAEQRQAAVEEARQRIQELPQSRRTKAEKVLENPDVRMVVALDAQSGKLQWEKPAELNRSCGKSKSGSMTQAAMVHNGVVVLFGVYLDGHYWQQYFAGEFDTRQVRALSAKDGKLLWCKLIGFRVRPLIIGDTLHAEPWAFDLHTGEPRTRIHPVTGQTDIWQFARPGHHCGCPAAAPNCLLFRSWNLGYYDLRGDYGTMHFGAHRPGCWINFIPAGGLLLVPEASAGCMCAFPNMCTVVFQPTEKNKAWAYYSAPGPMTPVKRLALNFGAPGDRNDAAGNLWLGYPRPGGSLVLKFDAAVSFHPGGRFVTDNSSYTPITGGDPWLFASAAIGLRKCTIPLLEEADGTALYDVRLAFADPVHDRPGQRVFDVKLQGKVVHENYDVAAAAGGRNRTVFARFDGIEVDGALTIELVPKTGTSDADQLPILQGVEIVRQRILTLGCAMPELLLSSLQPKQSVELKLMNLREETAAGTLKLIAPEGFDVSPKETDLALAAGQRRTIAVLATVKNLDLPAGDYALGIRIVRPDGAVPPAARDAVELERSVRVEHLGRRGRVVLLPVEDAYVHQRYPDRNRGTVGTLLIDGGDRKLGDRDHATAYLKFRLDVPGKPVGARLRIVNAGNPAADSGRICLVDQPWAEKQLTYPNRPKPGNELARIGRVAEHQVVECPLNVDLTGRKELSLMIDATSCDGVDYVSREGGKPAELIVEYEP